MRDDGSEGVIRRVIGGDAAAAAWVTARAAASAAVEREAGTGAGAGAGADTSVDALVLVMAALLSGDVACLDRAGAVARSSRDRQVVAIARAHLEGRRELVDALARDHLVDHPDSLIVAWMASGDVLTVRRPGPI